MKCVRCDGKGELDVISKVEIDEDGKNCKYWEKRQICNRCHGEGIVDAWSLPRGLVGK